jgi:hypothetical protein
MRIAAFCRFYRKYSTSVKPSKFRDRAIPLKPQTA